MDRPNPDLQQMVQHDRGTAVLERARRHLRLELEPHRDAVPVPRHERRPPLTQRDPRRLLERERRAIAPQRGIVGVDVGPAQPLPGFKIERTTAIAAPERPIRRIGHSASRAAKPGHARQVLFSVHRRT